MTTMATEARPIAVGDTVEWVGVSPQTGETRHPDLVGTRGRVVRVHQGYGGPETNELTLDDSVPRDIRTGWYARRFRLVEDTTDSTTVGGLPIPVGTRVNVRNSGSAVVTGPCECGSPICRPEIHIRVRYDDSGYHRNVGLSRVTVIEAAPVAEIPGLHGFREGQRVRVRSYSSNGTIIAHPTDAEQPAEQRMLDAYVCVLLDTPTSAGYYGGGRFVIRPGDVTPLDEPDVAREQATTTPVEIGPGVRVRVSNPAYLGSGGYVHPSFYGQEGVVVRRYNAGTAWEVRVQGVGTNYINESDLTVLDTATEQATNPPAAEDTSTIAVGDHVRYSWDQTVQGRVIRLGTGRQHVYQGTGQNRYAEVWVRSNEHQEDMVFYAGDIVLVERDPSPIPPPQANYAEGFEPGARVYSSDGRGLGRTVEKTEQNSPRRWRSRGYSVVTFDSGNTQEINNLYLSLRPDTDFTEMSDADKLAALQRLLHRVASYEAVRRNWCSEIDIALSHLAELMPPELRTVDRELGTWLTRHPQQIFMLDSGPAVGEVTVEDDDDDEPEDIDWQVCVRVEYETTDGFTVSNAHVTVQYTAPDDDGHSPTDYIDNGMVETGIDNSDLPAIQSSRDIRSWELCGEAPTRD